MLTLTPSHQAELAVAHRDVERAAARVDQDERIYGRGHVAKIHLRALSDATLRVLYLSAVGTLQLA